MTATHLTEDQQDHILGALAEGFGWEDIALLNGWPGADIGHNKIPLKNTPEDQAATDRAYTAAADELRQFIEQYEQEEAEKKEVSDRQKAITAEAKARGYNTKAMKKVIALRKRHADDIAEEMAAHEAGLSASRTQPGEASWMARRADDAKAAGRIAAKGRKDSTEA